MKLDANNLHFNNPLNISLSDFEISNFFVHIQDITPKLSFLLSFLDFKLSLP